MHTWWRNRSLVQWCNKLLHKRLNYHPYCRLFSTRIDSNNSSTVVYENHDPSRVRLYSIVAATQSVYWTAINIDHFLLPTNTTVKIAMEELNVEPSMITDVVTHPAWCLVGIIASIGGIVFVKNFAKNTVAKMTLYNNQTVDICGHTITGGIGEPRNFPLSKLGFLKPNGQYISFSVPGQTSMMIIDRKGKFTDPYASYSNSGGIQTNEELQISDQFASSEEKYALSALGVSWMEDSKTKRSFAKEIDINSPGAYQKFKANARKSG